jgi:hypothetical protein
MRNLIRTLLLVASVFVSAHAVSAQDREPREEERVETCAGPVVITRIHLWSEYEVTVNGRPILRTKEGDEGSEFKATPIPFILKHVRTPVAPFDEVVVFQQRNSGNACKGVEIWFLGLKRDGSYQVTKHIDYCGNVDPKIRVKSDRLTIVLPEAKLYWGHYFPAERWEYRNGEIYQLASRPKKHRR